MKRILTPLALILTVAGCSTVSDLPPGYRLGAQGAEGLAIVSLTLSGKDLGRVESFEYRVREAPTISAYENVKRRPYFQSARQHARWLQDKDAQGPAAGLTRLIVKDPALAEPLDIVESGKTIGRLAALRLPAGDYELYDWKLVVPNVYGGNEFTPRRAIGYRFTVEAGRAIYLGNVDLRMTEQDTYGITVENKAKRDLALLTKKVPSIGVEAVIYGPGVTTLNGTPQ